MELLEKTTWRVKKKDENVKLEMSVVNHIIQI